MHVRLGSAHHIALRSVRCRSEWCCCEWGPWLTLPYPKCNPFLSVRRLGLVLSAGTPYYRRYFGLGPCPRKGVGGDIGNCPNSGCGPFVQGTKFLGWKVS